ncbi:MAG: DUF1688 family protein [Burkholderiales bacterium]
MTAAVAAPAAHALLSTRAIRERAGNIARAVTAGRSPWFRIDRARLPDAAARVAAVTRRRYPDLVIPAHSRWRHFEAGGVDRRQELERALVGRTDAERARACIDLAVVSVLLDAGAGAAWSFAERETGHSFTRSEGLGVASFRAFMRGDFSATPGDPLRADAGALAAFDDAKIRAMFAVRDDNPLVGVEGRAALLRRLGAALVAERDVFAGRARPGGLFDARLGPRGLTPASSGSDPDRSASAPPRDLTPIRPGSDPSHPGSDPLIRGADPTITADHLLAALLTGLASIWPQGNTLDGLAVGDTWRHPHAGGTGATAGWVPFHKLSQWLAYSLLEPFAWAGVPVAGQDALTALPEYRNGGLLLDTGVLVLRDPALARVPHAVGSELVVEWRALTVALVDELAPLVRDALHRPDLPLACLLEGGTWAAGRELARELRGGEPPLAIASDGTVF